MYRKQGIISVTALQPEINIANKPETLNGQVQSIVFAPKLLPADVKVQAPISKDTVDFKSTIPEATQPEVDNEEDNKNEVAPKQTLWQKTPAWAKVAGAVVITLGAVAAYDHWGNDGKWWASLTGKTTPTNTKLPKGESIKNISNEYFKNTTDAIDKRIDALNQKRRSIELAMAQPLDDSTKKKYQKDLNKLEEAIGSFSEDRQSKEQEKEVLEKQFQLISRTGKAETKYMSFAKKVSEKLEKNPNYDFKKDKEMKKEWDSVVETFDRLKDIKKENVSQATLDPGAKGRFKALSQRFEYEIKERAKNGTLTQRDIYYINGAKSPDSIFRTMKYDNGKLYDCRKTPLSSVMCVDKEGNLLDAEENLLTIVEHYKKTMANPPVLFEVGSKDTEQLNALDKWLGQIGKSDDFDPNFYRKYAANLVTDETMGLDFVEENADYMAEILQNADNKQAFIEKWNESPTLPNIVDLKIVENGKKSSVKAKDCQNDIRIRLEGEDYDRRLFARGSYNHLRKDRIIPGYYDVEREALSKKTGFIVAKDGSVFAKTKAGKKEAKETVKSNSGNAFTRWAKRFFSPSPRPIPEVQKQGLSIDG